MSRYLKDQKSFNNKNNNDNDDNNDDDDGNGDLPRLPTPPSFPPKNNEFDSEFDSDDKKLTPTQKFILDKPQKEKLAVAVGKNQAFAAQPEEKTTVKKGKFSDDQLKYFQKEMKLLNQTKYQILMKKMKFRFQMHQK